MSGYEYLVRFLLEGGYRYEDHERVITFKIEGVNYIAFKNDDNPFLQITLGCNVEDESRIKLLELCNYLNRQKFILKFTVNSDASSVYCSYEFEPSAITSEDDFMSVFYTMDRATDEFYELLPTFDPAKLDEYE